MTIKDKQKLFMCNNRLSPYMIAEYELFFFFGQLLTKVILTILTFNIICLL